MTSRERVLAALNHREPDRVPIDFGGTAVSTIMVGPYRETCAKLGLDPSPHLHGQPHRPAGRGLPRAVWRLFIPTS